MIALLASLLVASAGSTAPSAPRGANAVPLLEDAAPRPPPTARTVVDAAAASAGPRKSDPRPTINASGVASGRSSDSLYRLSFPIDSAVVVLGIAGNLAPYALHAAEPEVGPTSSINALDRFAVNEHSGFADELSSVTMLGAAIGPAVFDGVATRFDRAWIEDTIVLAEAELWAGATVAIAKNVFPRPRPWAYVTSAPLSKDAFRSFFSGHTVLAFSGLFAGAFTASRRGAGAWVWIAAGTIGSSVAVERVLAGEHFPSDVLVGAAVGTAVGLAVPALHLRHAALAVEPVAGGAEIRYAAAL